MPKSPTFTRISAVSMMLAGLDVLVDHALLVRAGQRVQYLQHDRDGVRNGHWALVDHLAQAHAVDELHGQEWLSFVQGEVVDRDDVGMRASGGRLGLAPEALMYSARSAPLISLVEISLMATVRRMSGSCAL